MSKHATIAVAAFAATLGSAVYAQTMTQQLDHHAAQQARIAADEGRGRLDPRSDGAVHDQAALVEHVEADALAADNAASLRQLSYAETDLDRAIARAEQGQPRANTLDRMHAQVADAREVQQQRWIAAGLRDGTLDRQQTAQLERDQAAIVARQAALERRGHESVDQALQVQHLQDQQDWSIRTGSRG